MPANKQPKTLQNLIFSKISEQVLQFSSNPTLYNHIFDELFKNPPQRTWKTVAELLESRNLPISYQKVILENALEILEARKNKLGSLGLVEDKLDLKRQNEEYVYLLIHYICVSRNACWKFTLRRAQKFSVIFLLRYIRNISELKIIASLKEEPFQEVLARTSRSLTSLDLFICKKIDCLTIGRICKHLTKLRLHERYISVKNAKQICFKNYPIAAIKNPICETLEHFHVDDLTMEVLVIVLKNMRKLKTLKPEGILNYSQIMSECKGSEKDIFPCSLDYIRVRDSIGNIDFETVYNNFPYLKTIDVTCKEDQFIHQNYEVNILIIHCLNDIRDITESPLCASFKIPWSSLHQLALDFLIYPTVIDFSLIFLNCPNVHTLYIKNCEQKSGKILPEFKEVKKLLMCTEGIIRNHSLLCHLSPYLKTFALRKSKNANEAPLTHDLLEYSFPCLEYLEYTPSIYSTKKDAFQLLNQCPKLKILGLDKEYDLYRAIIDETKLQNWDLAVVDVHSCLLDLF